MAKSNIDWSQYEDKADESSEKVGQPIDENTGLSGVGLDLLGSALNAKDFAQDIPNKLEKSGKYIEENPGKSILHNAGQLAGETGDIIKGMINAPYNLNQYLARKHLLPQVLGKLGKSIPHLPEDTGAEKALGLKADKEKGDELIRAIPDLLTTSMGGASLGKQIKNVATRPSKQALFKRAIEEKVNAAAEKIGMSKKDLNALKDSLKLEYSKLHPGEIGELSAVGQEVAINKKNRKLEEIKPLTEIPEKEVGEIPEAPDTKSMLEKHQELIDKSKTEAENMLGIKENPSLKAGEKVKKSIEDLEKSSTDIYNSARNHYVDKNIMADNSAEIKSAVKELEALKDADELAPGYGSGTAEQKALQENIDALKVEKVKASDIFSLMRTSQQLANKFRMKRKGATQLEWERLTKIADNLDNHADKLGTRLEEVGGQDVRSMIKQANKGYRTFKQLSKLNPVGKAAMKGNIPNNALIKLAEDHPANEFLNALVKSDPELRKNLLASYSGENNVNKLTNPSSLTKKYIESLPEVEDKINAFKNAVSEFKGKEKEASKINKAHDDLVKSMKEAANEQKVRQDAIKESDKIKKQIKFHENAIPKIKAKMKNLDKDSAEHKRLEKELGDHNKHIEDKNHLLKKYGGVLLKLTGVSSILHKAGL